MDKLYLILTIFYVGCFMDVLGSSPLASSRSFIGAQTKSPHIMSSFYRYLAAVARAKGSHGANWVTDLMLFNLDKDGHSLDLLLSFVPGGIDGGKLKEDRWVTLPPFGALFLPNILEETFALTEAAGNLRISAEGPFLATSRTYNDQGGEGTYGIFVPSQDADEALFFSSQVSRQKEKAVILGIQQDENFRTNIGFSEVSGMETEVKISFYTLSGDPVLVDRLLTIPPYGWVQKNVMEFGLTQEGVFLAEVTVETGGGVLAYASPVDNRSGDAVFIPAIREGLWQDWVEQTIAAIARAQGAFGTFWRTDLYLYNPNEALLTVEARYEASLGSFQSTVTLDPQEGTVLRDVITSLFPEIQGDTAGGLHLFASEPFLALSRTYNEDERGSYGIAVPAKPISQLIKTGEKGYLLPLVSNESYRCNIGLTEASGEEAQGNFIFISSDGNQFGIASFTVPPYKNIQMSLNISAEGINLDNFYAIVNVTKGGTIFPYATIIDKRSSDALFISAIK